MIDEAHLDEKVNIAFTNAAIPGMAIIASRNGEVVYEKYVG